MNTGDRLRFVPAVLFAAAVTGCMTKAGVPDPCTLVTLEEIRIVAPEAASATPIEAPSDALAKTCVWKNSSGVDQIRLISKASDGSPVEPALKALMRNQSAARVAAVPSVAPDAAAAFYGSGDAEIMSILIAQNAHTFLDLRPQAAGIRGEKSQSFAAAASILKKALERAGK